MGIDDGIVIAVGMVVGKPEGMVVGNPEGIVVGNPEGMVVGNPDGTPWGKVGPSGFRTVCPAPCVVPGAAC